MGFPQDIRTISTILYKYQKPIVAEYFISGIKMLQTIGLISRQNICLTD